MIAVITTFYKEYYEQFGRQCVESVLEHWPQDIELHVYAENCEVSPRDRLFVHDLHASSPKLVDFKRAHAGPVRFLADYRKDAVRFANKVFAVLHACTHLDADKAFWLDADTFAFADVPEEFLHSCLPDDCYTSCLMRDHMHTECSFVGYNLQHPVHEAFMARWESFYTDGTVFDLPEWHDCATYDATRQQFEQQGLIKTLNLSGAFSHLMHPFVNSELGQFMDHLKGPARKQHGRSSDLDLAVPRTETYWAGGPSETPATP
jgi:hypothetical protein